MSEEYSNGYARGYEAGQESMLKLAEQPAPVQPDETLLSFYQATDFTSLVSAMDGHIKKMQSKLQSNPHTAIDAWNNREMARATPQPPAQRTWVELEPHEANDIMEKESWGPEAISLNGQLLRTIERTAAKLREKNT